MLWPSWYLTILSFGLHWGWSMLFGFLFRCFCCLLKFSWWRLDYFKIVFCCGRYDGGENFEGSFEIWSWQIGVQRKHHYSGFLEQHQGEDIAHVTCHLLCFTCKSIRLPALWVLMRGSAIGVLFEATICYSLLYEIINLVTCLFSVFFNCMLVFLLLKLSQFKFAGIQIWIMVFG